MTIETKTHQLNGNELTIPNSSDYVIFTGTSNPQLAEDAARHVGIDCYNVAKEFEDGETYVELPESVRDKHVFIVQSTGPKHQDRHLMQAKMTAWASKVCGAEKVTAIFPYLAYSRADRTNKGRICKTIEMVSNELWASGIDKIVTFDLHSEQSATGDGRPRTWDNFYGSYVLVPAIKNLNIDKYKARVIAPDANAAGRASYINDMCNFPEDITTVVKRRNYLNREDIKLNLYGDFNGTTPLIVDDMIDTGGTVIKNLELLEKKGAEPGYLIVTHGVLSGPALSRLKSSRMIQEKGVFITNTIEPSPEVLDHEKIRVLDISPLIAQVIYRTVNRKKGMSELFSAVAEKVTQLN